MAHKNTAAFGIYATRDAVERAIDTLESEGYRTTDISVLSADNAGSRDIALEKNTKAAEGAVTGASTGALAGGAMGWLASAGAVAIPGVGPFIAAGPIVAALAGAAAGGAVGGLTGALIGAGVPEYEAKRYEGKVKDGGILLSIHCDASHSARKAKDSLKRTGAKDVSSTGEAEPDLGEEPYPRTGTPI